MTNSRWLILVLFCFIGLGYCTNPEYYDPELYNDCFQNAQGWYHLAATCIFPLTQFERNYLTAAQMCGAINHSIGYRETNWLIASQLLELFQKELNRNLMKLYWTGLIVKNEEVIVVQSEDATDDTTAAVADFTSMYNPLWAQGEPRDDLSPSELAGLCIALDLRNSSNFGWRALPCSYQLPILCQNYACLPGTFRCADNSKCIPSSFQHDGFKDCLDGSDEKDVSESIPISTPNSLLSNILRENPIYEWPMIVSSGGVLTPTTVRYGRGECTHRWTVLSPIDQHFIIWIKWMSPTTSTSIFIEGKDQNGRIFLNSRNATSSITLTSSSFILTASDTDTRRIEFQIYYQVADNSLCQITENNKLFFNSELIPMSCNYHFSTESLSSYVAILIRKCEGTSPNVATIQFNNFTISLAPRQTKKLLIIPSNSLSINVDSTWPQSDTKLDIQFLELKTGEEKLDVFLIDNNLEVEWIPRSSEVCMGGQFRTLTVNMIVTSSEDSEQENPTKSTWDVRKFSKSCSEDNVQIVSRNQSTYLRDSRNVSGFGPTTVVIHQSAEPFEFHSIYSIQQEDSGRFLDESDQELEAASATPTVATTSTSPEKSNDRCKLPTVIYGYVKSVSNEDYFIGTNVEIGCNQGYMLISSGDSLICYENGIWRDGNERMYPSEHPTVRCLPINCPTVTDLEINKNYVPDSYDTAYGSVRKYYSTGYLNIQPFCVCGDQIRNQWSCYNDATSEYEYPNACILPEAVDATFVPSQIVFMSGETINMLCMICNSVVKLFQCENGLWKTIDGAVQPYDKFECRCQDEPGFQDPCKPHGSYVQHNGFYSCDCENGYKYFNGTCQDRDECAENNTLCDKTQFCRNFDGGFSCDCPNDYHLYNGTDSYWAPISQWLIDGYSCVETTCLYSNDWSEQHNINVIPPPSSNNVYRSGSSMGYSYATNICDSLDFNCVFQFTEYCISNAPNSTMIPIPDPSLSCSEEALSDFSFSGEGTPSRHVFQMLDVYCKNQELTMIGRPTIFCNANSQWEILPACVYQSCSNITQFIQAPLHIKNFDRPLGNGFEVTTVVHLECESGYTIPVDSATITCTRQDGQFVWLPSIPKCVPISTTSSYIPTITFTPTTTSTPGAYSTYFPFLSSAGTTQMTSDPTTWFPTASEGSFIGYDDIVIEGSMTFEERNILNRPEIWTQTGDWIWSPSGCIVHQWTFPVSFFVTSIPIQLNSDQIELLIDVSQCDSSIQVGVSSTSDGFIPPLSDFRPVINTTSSGSFVVKLKNLKPNLAISIVANGYVRICGVTIRENICDEVDYNGLHLSSSKPFSMRRYLSASCANNQRLPAINGYCDSRRGWVIQNKPCVCDPKPICTTPAPIPQFDQTSGNLCAVDSCQNGECIQHDGYYDCRCNTLFIRDIRGTVPFCKPDHCALTSRTRTSGYDCETGLDDQNKKCDNPTEYFGLFCQYQGSLLNQNYIYLLAAGNSNAIATNVCDSVDTEYAIPGVRCAEQPTTTPRGHDDSSCISTCKGSVKNCHYAYNGFTPYNGGAVCECNTGAFGRSCEAYKFCFKGTDNQDYLCQNGGTCDFVNQTCNCLSNFYGDFCENAREEDNCFGRKDCVNGKCHSENGVMYCNCDPGYIPDSSGRCTIPWDLCELNNPCQQGGKCNFNTTSGEQTCDCSSSHWKGQHCEIPPQLDDCTVCENTQKCYNNFTQNVRCQCDLGFSGDHCLDNVYDCNFEPCFNGGTCQNFNHILNGDLIETYNCTCPTGYSGTNCETQMAPNCSQFITCENGGTCELISPDSAVCHCTDQFFGMYCEKRCSDECVHAHGCHQLSNGTLFCECDDGFTKPLCDQVDNVCKAKLLSCQNSGSCNVTTQSCDCPDYFNGTYCETNTNKCETNSIVCENGGRCLPPSGICECLPHFTGNRCENQIQDCREKKCFNGGTCIEGNGTCACLPGSTGDACQDLGQPCVIVNADGTQSPYCLNGGNCTVTESGAVCDCNNTNFTGRRCDIKATFNFNLVFNGMNYAPDIISTPFANVTIAQFTICSFVQYNQPIFDSNAITDASIPTLQPWLIARGYGKSQMIVFDNQGFFICDPDDVCTREEISKKSSYRPTTISANTWHHFCIVSPENLTNPNYAIYLDGVQLQPQFAPVFNPGAYGYLQLAPKDLTNKTQNRFVGMISITQLYIIRLNETQIAQLAYDCYNTLSNTPLELANKTFVNWNGGFTRVSASNPGVFIDPSGICSGVKCMFGRQANSNNYNSTGTCDKDRISPTVLRCPKNKFVTTSEDFVKVQWKDEDVAFFDNIGVVKVQVNFHNGQQFGVGITAVRYVAFDAAGNSAECTFDVVVVQKACPSNDQITVGEGTLRFGSLRMAPFTSKVALIECNDNHYPIETRPRFYVCDIMGDFKYGGWLEGTPRKYYLPACGKTVNAEQALNGTVVGDGTCEQVYQRLQETIWTSVNCDQMKSCNISIYPQCDTSNTIGMSRAEQSGTYSLQYTFSTKNATETISTTVLTNLQTKFTFVQQDSSVDCDPSFPIHDTNGNVTICVSCAAGTFANTTQNQCMDCPINTYRPSTSTDQFSCTPCPVNTTTGDIAGAVEESQCYRICDMGQYEANGLCLDCPEGTFGPTQGLQRCICCGFDTSTFGVGKKTRDDCTKTCPPGQEMIRNATETAPYCQDCDYGYYKEGNNGPCLQCPRGLTTSSMAMKSVNDCNQLNCIDENTRKNRNITVGPNTTYSQLCITCEQGTFQNKTNSDTCMPCTDLSEDVINVPVTCQSTCSSEIPTEGCNCQLQSRGNNSMIIRNCVPEVKPAHQNSNAIKIVLPIVFGVLLIIIIVVLICYRKQIIAWFRKIETSDNQHVAPSHWNQSSPRSEESNLHTPSIYQSETRSSIRARIVPAPPTIPRPNLKIVTDRNELNNLPPLPSSSTPSFHVDSAHKHVGFASGIENSSGMRHLGSKLSTLPSSNNTVFEANGSPIMLPSSRRETDSDNSSLSSYF